MDRETVVLDTEYGYVRGVLEGEFLRFKGVPFARADRFEAPVRYRWNGVLDCTSFGKKAMQIISPFMPDADRVRPEDFSEECLNLNIYVPKSAKGEAKLPVLLEIHGGGFQGGSNQENSPEAVVKQENVIYVSVNYRLGAFGFLYLKPWLGEEYAASGNCGLQDLRMSVRWVHENISCFGGDPERITVLGSSAGAKAIGGLMMIPEFQNYVGQLILSSGATQSIRSSTTAAYTALRFLQILQSKAGELNSLSASQKAFLAAVDPDPFQEQDYEAWQDLMLNLSAEDLLTVQKEFSAIDGNTCLFGPVADGVLIPENWEKLAAKGTLWNGRAMIGCSRNEMGASKLFIPDYLDRVESHAFGLFGENGAIARAKYLELMGVSGEVDEKTSDGIREQIWNRIMSDYMYRLYSYRLAERLFEKECKVWQYSVEFLPAYHVFDVGMAFGGMFPALLGSEENRKRSQKVGALIWRSFLNFVQYKDPSADEGITCPEEEILSDWRPLSVRSWKGMFWDTESQVRTIPEDDVLDGFPEDVYRWTSPMNI